MKNPFTIIHKKIIKEILSIFGSRSLGQALTFFATLIVARYYSPNDIGRAAIITSLAQLTGQFTSLRFQNMAMVARVEKTKQILFRMGYISNFCFLTIAYMSLVIAMILGFKIDIIYFWLPIYGVLVSLTSYVLPAQMISLAKMRLLNAMLISVPFVAASTQLAIAIYHPTVEFLLLSRISGLIAGIAISFPLIYPFLNGWCATSTSRYQKLIIASSREILFGIPEATLSFALFQLPIYIFTFLTMEDNAGAYWLAFNLVFVPYTVMSMSIRPYILREIGKSANNPALTYSRLRQMVLIAAVIGIFCILVLGIFGKFGVNLLFGQKWSQAGIFTMSLSFLLAGFIVQTPLAAAATAIDGQKIVLQQTFMHLVFSATGLITFYHFLKSATSAIIGFSIFGAIVCIAYTALGLYRYKIRTNLI